MERATNFWGDCGEIVKKDEPIKLPYPQGDFTHVGGWWWIKRDKDGAEIGCNPKMLTICKECPCKK